MESNSPSRCSRKFLHRQPYRVVALALGLLLLAVSVARAQTVSATITVGNSPSAVAIDPVTNKIYVVNNVDGTVSVIDGATNAVTTVNVGTDPVAIAVDPDTNKIYVANETADTVSVIDGATNNVTTVDVGVDPDALAVDSVTGTLYVVNKCGTDASCASVGTVTAIDETTGNANSMNVGSDPVAIAVDPVTNMAYVVNEQGDSVSVINGATDAVTNVSVAYSPDAVAVDPATDKIFVTDKCGNDSTCASTSNGILSVIDGSSPSSATAVTIGSLPSAVTVDPEDDVVYVLDQVSGASEITMVDGSLDSILNSASAGISPVSIADNPLTGATYVANAGSNDVTVVTGTSNTSQTVNVGASPSALAINPVTNKIYVANQSDDTVSVIDGTPASFVSNYLAPPVPLQLVAVDPATNKAYLVEDNSILAVDASTFAVDGSANVGTQPMGLAVNPVTDMIYVANEQSNNVSVIDGSTDTVSATVNVGIAPVRVAVDPITDKIYVTNWCDNQPSCSGAPNTVSVIDGAANAVSSTVTVGYEPYEIAANPATDKIYVLNLCGSDPSCASDANVSVVDGTTDTVTATVPVELSPLALAVDRANDKIYVANSCGNDSTCSSDGTVSIIDGATNNVTNLPVGPLPRALAVNPASNEIDVLNFSPRTNTTCSPTLPGSVWAINGTTNQVTASVTVGPCPLALSANPATDRMYVVNYDESVSIIDGITHTIETTLSMQTFNALPDVMNGELFALGGGASIEIYPGVPPQPVPLTTSIAGFSGNVSLSSSPMFTFTTSSTFSPVAPPIQHVYYQVDTLQGPWLEATGSAPNFTGASPTLTRGPHILYAFATDGEDATSTSMTADMIGTMSTYLFTVSGTSTSTTLTADSTTVDQGASVTFTASVSAVPPASGTPTGTVTFTDGATALGTGTLDSSGSATFTTSALTAGTHSITAFYSGDLSFLSSASSSLNESVLATTTTTLSPLSSTTFGTSVTLTATVTSSTPGTPTGTVTFMDGTTTLGTGTLNSSGVATFSTSLFSGGSHSLSASYAGSADFASSASATVVLTVNPAATTSTLTASANPTYSGNAVTFTAAVTSSGGTPSGSVTFNDGSTALSTVTLGSNGQAAYTTSSLSVGSHTITAAYAGGADFAPSTSSALTEAVNAAAFTLAIPSASATIQPGQSASFSINVAPEGDLTTAVSFACTGLPSMSSCSFSPSSVTPGANTAQDTLTISTTAPSTSELLPLGLPGRPNWPLFAALVLLSGLALLLTRKRNQPARRALRRLAWSCALAAGLAITLAACGGGGSSTSSGSSTQTIAGTPAGTYSVTVTGTSGSESVASPVSLTVQ